MRLTLQLSAVPLDLDLQSEAPQLVADVLRRLGAFERGGDGPAAATLHLVHSDDAWPRPAQPLRQTLELRPADGGELSLRRWDLEGVCDAGVTRLSAEIAPMTAPIEECLRLALAAAFARAAPQGLMVHAACTVHDGSAWLFPAYSGTGKSTLAALTPGDGALSDELALLTRDAAGRWWAWPSPFWNHERSWPGGRSAAAPAPLGRIAFIRQAPRTAFLGLDADDALVRLLQQVVVYPLHEDAAACALEAAASLLGALPPAHVGLLDLVRGASPYSAPTEQVYA